MHQIIWKRTGRTNANFILIRQPKVPLIGFRCRRMRSVNLVMIKLILLEWTCWRIKHKKCPSPVLSLQRLQYLQSNTTFIKTIRNKHSQTWLPYNFTQRQSLCINLKFKACWDKSRKRHFRLPFKCLIFTQTVDYFQQQNFCIRQMGIR